MLYYRRRNQEISLWCTLTFFLSIFDGFFFQAPVSFYAALATMLLGTTNQNVIQKAADFMHLPAPYEAAKAIGLANSMYSTPVIDIKNWIISNNPVNEEFRRLIDSIEGSEILEGVVGSEGSLTEKLRTAVEKFSHELIISPNNASELKSIASLSGLYFGGKFETKFHHKNTVDRKCYSADPTATPVDCQLMRTVATVKFDDNGERRVVCIPYKTRKTFFSFKELDGPFYLVFAELTDAYKNKNKIAKGLLFENYIQVIDLVKFDCDKYEEKKVDLMIPRLRITSLTELTDKSFMYFEGFTKGSLSKIGKDAKVEHIAQVIVLEVDSEEESDADVLEDTKGLPQVRIDGPTVIGVVAPGNQVLLAGAIDDFTSVLAPKKEITHTLVEVEE
eukprot:GHVR01077717.1.p1 GENE.GHVR01077717.1~~GHVR01077717.1.p1  ORF type:complete len:390 (+),score=65.63 GHVR01077717.1:133-1302(+)